MEPQFQKLAAKLYFACVLVATRTPKVTPNHILDGFLWPKRLPKSSKITPNLNKIGAKNKNVCIHGHYWKKYCDFLCSSTCPRVFCTHVPQKFTKKVFRDSILKTPKRTKRFQKFLNVILTKSFVARGDQRELQLQFLAAERNLGWILGAKRAPKVILNHPKSQKIGAKNKNVVMHGRLWKKYRDFVC